MEKSIEIRPPFIKHDEDFLDMIAFSVCHVCDMDTAMLSSDQKSRKYSDPRNLYMHFARVYCDVSFREIGLTTNRVAMTVKEAYVSIKDRFERGDRRIYSRYLRCKTVIDEAVETFYPATWGERISHIDEVSRVDLCL